MKLLRGQLAAVCVRQALLPVSSFADEDACRAWAKDAGLDPQTIERAGESWRIIVRSEDQFIPGTDRVLRDAGISVTAALPIHKAGATGTRTEFDVDELHFLENINVGEITLCRGPILGTAAQFAVIKSRDAQGKDIAFTTQKYAAICKADSAKRQVFGRLAVSDLPDTMGDIIAKSECEAASYRFMESLRTGSVKGDGVGEEHQIFRGIGRPIASWFDEEGVLFGAPNSWCVGVQVDNDEVWKAIESGEITGFSFGGTAVRRKAASGEVVLRSKGLERAALVSISKAVFPTRDAAAVRVMGLGFHARTIVDHGDLWGFPQGGVADGEAIDLGGGVSVQKAAPSKETPVANQVNKALVDLDLYSELSPKVRAAVYDQLDGFVVALFVDRVVFEYFDCGSDLYMVPFTVDASNAVVLGEPVQVQRQFVEVTKSITPAIQEWTAEDKLKARPVAAVATVATTVVKAKPERMGLLEKIRRALGLTGTTVEGEDMERKEVEALINTAVPAAVAKAMDSAFAPIIARLDKIGTQTDKSDSEPGPGDAASTAKTMSLPSVVALSQQVVAPNVARSEPAPTTPPVTPVTPVEGAATPAAAPVAAAPIVVNANETEAEKATFTLLKHLVEGQEKLNKAVAGLAQIVVADHEVLEQLKAEPTVKGRIPGRPARRSAANPDLFHGLGGRAS